MSKQHNFPVDFDTADQVLNIIDASSMDELVYRYQGDSISSGVLQIRDRLHPEEPWAVLATVDFDGDKHTVDVSKSHEVQVWVDTTEADKDGNLYVMLEQLSIIDGGSA